MSQCMVTDEVRVNSWPCTTSFSSRWSSWMVGDEATYRALTGATPNDAISRTLENGGVVVAGDSTHLVSTDGTITLHERGSARTVVLDAVVAPPGEVGDSPRFNLLLPTEVHRILGFAVHNYGVTAMTTRPPTPAELAAARSSLVQSVDNGLVGVGEPFTAPTMMPLLLLLIAASVLAIVATATAVGLANADARPDLATLAAIGAAPRTRRWLSASNAAVVSLLGTTLGLIGGLIIGVAAVNSSLDNNYGTSSWQPTIPLAVPWSQLGLLALVVPLAAIALAWLFTRSRLPMVQRID
jgi:putative ABC transport system permease protein